MASDLILVTGAGGFIGHHLVKYLVDRGYQVRGVDIKAPEFALSAAQEFQLLDLRQWDNCVRATRDVAQVYALAAETGGVGFLSSVNKAKLVCGNTLIDMQTIEAARMNQVRRFLFASSASVYPLYLERQPDVTPLREDDAYPADAEDGHGWEKLYMERTCRHYREEFGLETRVVRLHNIFGPLCTFDGGREQSAAAICRKVALAAEGGTIEVWGDGKQTRSYCFIDDCLEGIYRLMQSNYHQPLNLGQERLVSIEQLVDMVAAIAGKTLGKMYDLTKPKGVRGRTSDNHRLRKVLRWEPSIPLEDGLASTYQFVTSELRRLGQLPAVSSAS